MRRLALLVLVVGCAKSASPPPPSDPEPAASTQSPVMVEARISEAKPEAPMGGSGETTLEPESGDSEDRDKRPEFGKAAGVKKADEGEYRENAQADGAPSLPIAMDGGAGDKPAEPAEERLLEMGDQVGALKQKLYRAHAKMELLKEVVVQEQEKDELQKDQGGRSRQLHGTYAADLQKATSELERSEKGVAQDSAAAAQPVTALPPANGPVTKAPPLVLGLDGYATTTRDAKLSPGIDEGRHVIRLEELLVAGEKPLDNGLLGHGKAAEKPEAFIPRTCYFENTYLGGNAAYLERLRRLDEALAGAGAPHRLAHADAQAFDPPERAGMALTASVDTRWLDRPGRVFLQVGLRGSDRFGWRRPPLELVLVIDAQAIAGNVEPAVETLAALLRGLGAQDRLAVLVSGTRAPVELAPLSRIRALQGSLPPKLDALTAPADTTAYALAEAMAAAGRLLHDASENRTTLPGTQTVLVLTSGTDEERVQAAQARSHALTVQGIVTSVIEIGGGTEGPWWSVANAGYGSYHRIQAGGAGAAIDAELESLSRVVARLLRINIRLAPGVEAVRVLGSKVLGEEEKRLVKAREVATDQNLSKTIGIASDRGEDDDGIQTVIPYFLGGESHVVVVELWVEKPGKIADVTLRYKDMVTLGNATASASSELRNVPRPPTGEQVALSRNLHGFRVAEALGQAAERASAGDVSGAAEVLRTARSGLPAEADADAQLLEGFERIASSQAGGTLGDALRLAAERRIGEPRP